MLKKLIIIPAYNEQDNLANLISSIRAYASDYDYLIINDCSGDNTENVCIANGYNHITLCNNLGIGGAIQTGYKYALNKGYDLVVQVDGDGQHDIKYLKNLEKCFLDNNKLDFVIGSRFIDNIGYQSTAYRRFGIGFLSLLVKLLTEVEIRDVTSGFRMANSKVVKIFAYSYPIDYPEPESIITLLRKGLIVQEVPVVMKERQSGTSSIQKLKAAYYMIKVSLAMILDFYK